MKNKNHTISNGKKLSSFLLIILTTIPLTRIWAVSLFYIFGTDSNAIKIITTDQWHHYQVGLLLSLAGFLLYTRKDSKTLILTTIGLGIFLEEWAIVLYDLGLNTKALYMTLFDFALIMGIIGILYIFSKIREE